MNNSIEDYQEIIPEFVVKLYHILDNKEYKDQICWVENGTQILIKNPKKLQQKVLPCFFRHRHLASFIRQLNMYKFNKVNKIARERSHMYFKNEYFRQGDFEGMKLMTRNQKKRKTLKTTETLESESIFPEGKSSSLQLDEFKEAMISKFALVKQLLEGIRQKNPQQKNLFGPALKICEDMLDGGRLEEPFQQAEHSMMDFFEGNKQTEEENNMLGKSMKQIPVRMNSFIFPSICSLTNLEV